jgi:peptidoglycan/xylan/chitin deacetylase (PgdA/CDA1 family)
MSDVLVLCYHAVSPTWAADLSVTPERLQHQLRRLLSHGYRGATFAQALTAPSARRLVVVTFDDAYRSVFELALPILARLGLPGTVFVPTAFAGSEQPMAWPGIDHWLEGPHRDELVPMSWRELRELRGRGWEVGSHTVSHPRLTSLGDEELAREVGESRLACDEGIGARCASIAYPYGDVDSRVVAAARAAGYEFGAALPVRAHRPRPLEWPRVGVYHGDSGWRFALKASRAVRRVRATAAGRRPRAPGA